MEYLNTFDEVVLWFDNDEPGSKAIAEVSALFPPGKVYTVDTGDYKVANEILKKSGVKGVLHYYYEVKKFTPSGIVNANEGGFEALMEDKESDEVYTTPFTGLEIAKGAMTTFVSGSGMGKSTIVREIGHHLLTTHSLTVGHVALEENNSVSKRAYLGIELNESIVSKKKWHIYKEEPKNVAKIKEAYDKVIGTDRLYLYNHFGSLDSDSLLNKLRYLAVGAGCDVIILDHISIVVSGLEDMGDNERRVIDVLMTKLRSLVEETGVGMILVSHLKRPSGDKSHEDGVQISLGHLRGSGSIAQLSDKVIGLEGNQQDEEHSHERVIRCLKDREEGEKVGILGHATYQPEIGRLIATDEPEDTEGGFTDEQEPDF
jgi:twinkle protein